MVPNFPSHLAKYPKYFPNFSSTIRDAFLEAIRHTLAMGGFGIDDQFRVNVHHLDLINEVDNIVFVDLKQLIHVQSGALLLGRVGDFVTKFGTDLHVRFTDRRLGFGGHIERLELFLTKFRNVVG